MIKQKIALAVSTLFLLSTLVVPGLVFALETQTQSLTLTGNRDIWCEAYTSGGGCTLAGLTLVDGSGSQLTASASSQQAYGTTSYDNTLTDNDLVGVINQQAAEWALSINTSASTFTGGTSGGTIAASNLLFATTGDATQMAAATTVTHDGNASYTLTANDGTLAINDALYDDFTGYTYVETDVDADENIVADFGVNTNITGDASGGAVEILSTYGSANTPFGIYAVGVGFNLTVPGGTPADTYTATITYTLATPVA